MTGAPYTICTTLGRGPGTHGIQRLGWTSIQEIGARAARRAGLRSLLYWMSHEHLYPAPPTALRRPARGRLHDRLRAVPGLRFRRPPAPAVLGTRRRRALGRHRGPLRDHPRAARPDRAAPAPGPVRAQQDQR